MKRTILITENQLKTIVKVLDNKSEYNDEIFRPLALLRECKFSLDNKYVIFENTVYYTETGLVAPINEGWLSNALHIGADVASAVSDFILPGSGAIIDTINAASYIIEAQFKPDNEKDSLYLMAAITFAFVVIPGPLQAASVPLKSALKSGKLSAPIVKKTLPTVGKYLGKIITAVPNLIKRAIDSPLGKKILGKWGSKIVLFINKFVTRIKNIFEPLMKNIEKSSAGKMVKGAGRMAKGAGKTVMSTLEKTSFIKFLKNIPKIKNGSKLLRKLGFVEGKQYKYILKNGKSTTAKVTKITNDKVMVLFGNSVKAVPQPIETFARGAIGAPWGRRGYSVAAPFFVKRFASMMNSEGTDIDDSKLDQMEDLDPETVSSDSMSYIPTDTMDVEDNY